MNKKEFDKLVEAHKQANVGARQIQDATNILTTAGFDTQRISLLMIELAKAFRGNLQEITEQVKGSQSKAVSQR